MAKRRETPYKVYIEVDLTDTAEGVKRLRGFRLEAGDATIPIVRHDSPVPRASMNAGGCGMMYLCYLENHMRIELTHEEFEEYVDLWFVSDEAAWALQRAFPDYA